MTISPLSLSRGKKVWAKRPDGLEAKLNEVITDVNAFALSGSPSVPAAYGVDTQAMTGNVTLTALSTLTIITSTNSSGLSITLGDCTAQATMYDGQNYAFFNKATNAVEIKDSAGTVLSLCGPGELTILHLRDDTTAAGTWDVWDALQMDIAASLGSNLFL